MHWGNIGSAVAGAPALIIAIAALIRSPAALRDWRERQRAQAEAAREEATTIRAERRRGLTGWSSTGVNTYPVDLVRTGIELEQLRAKLVSGEPSPFVVLRVTGSTEGNSANLAQTLRQTIEAEGFISRAPTTGEAEALDIGLRAMGIRGAVYGQSDSGQTGWGQAAPRRRARAAPGGVSRW
jgi:hypothetical protein